MASASNAASGPMRTDTFNRSTSSCVLVRACAGLPAVSAVCSSTGRPASVLLRSLKNTVRPCSICRPPEASGPVLMVRKPTRMGPACAGAAGTLSTCVATPAASAPLMTVRRSTLMTFLPGWFVLGRTELAGPTRKVRGDPLEASRLDVLVSGPRLAIVDGVFEEFVGVVGPELADVGIGLHHRVHVAAILFLDPADVDVADHVAVFVKPHWAARSILDLVLAQRLDQRLLVLDPGIDGLERGLEHRAVGVGRRRVHAGIDLVIALHALDELLVGRRVDLRGIEAGRIAAQSVITHLLQQRFIDRRHAAEDRKLAA